MGWDADALRNDRYIASAPDFPELKAAFEAVEDEVRRLSGGADPSLGSGGLDFSGTRWYIEEAIGREAVGIFSPEEVRALVTSARWRNPTGLDEHSLTVYWSARKFLETCAEHGLGVWME